MAGTGQLLGTQGLKRVLCELCEGCKVKLKGSYREYFLDLPVKTITCKLKRLQAEARLGPRKGETRRLSATSG